VARRVPSSGPTSRRGRAAALALLVCAVAVAATHPTGAAGRILEKDLNLDIALRIQHGLAAAAVPVVMTRTDDRTVSLAARTELANARGADVFVSIHNNGSRDPDAGGTEVYHQIRGGGSRVLGEAIAAELARSPGLPTRLLARRGSRGDYYFVLRTARMPAVIVEGAYLTNPREARLLAQDAFRQAIADSAARGILAYQRTLVAAPAPALEPPKGVRVEALPAPADAKGEALGAWTVRLSWRGSRTATAYHVYRDGAFLGRVEDPAGLLGPRETLTFTDPWTAPGQRYVYEVAAALDVAGRTLESAPARIVVRTPPILVALDPGHGGRDPGAVGSI
jgi:N-acetylmuramoyl-L-alanine amidase